MSLYSSFPLDILITSCFVTADLLVALHGGRLLFHIQAFDNGVFTVSVPYVDKGFLDFQFSFQTSSSAAVPYLWRRNP